jgi:hypothetical protein
MKEVRSREHIDKAIAFLYLPVCMDSELCSQWCLVLMQSASGDKKLKGRTNEGSAFFMAIYVFRLN